MNSVWFMPELSEELINKNDLFENTESLIADFLSNRIEITKLVENMAGVLTSKDPEHRERGMRFFTKVLSELPKQYFNESQIKFIARFYIDRLKDNHRVVPHVLEGFLVLMDMKNFNINWSGEFFINMFREVTCQSQVRQDRYNIYLLIQKLVDKDVEYVKTLGSDFVYGVISTMDGERDPRNLLFLFTFLPKFISQVPLGHLAEEMFDVFSCYYPIDFHPSPDDPAAVTRQDLANALIPCLCASPAFGEQCLILLIEKLDSALNVAKLDSLHLLTESCKTFNTETYGPFLKALWSSIQREITHKNDEAIKMAAHEALSALVKKLSSTAKTDHAFEGFIEGIIISMQTAIAESTTVVQFVQATKVLLTTANASKESCLIVTGTMIPATIAFYNFKSSPKLQVCSLDFLGDLYCLAKHWNILDALKNHVKDIPQHCLTAVSNPSKEYQIAGFKTLIRVIDVLEENLVLPFVEVMCHNIQYSQDQEVMTISIDAVHHIGKKYPELVMSLVVNGKLDLRNLTADKSALKERLNLLVNLISIDDFTKVIIEEMLKLIASNDKEAPKVIEALSESMSNSSLYSNEKVTQIESDYNIINSIIAWIVSEIEISTQEALSHGFILISNTMSSLPPEKQKEILDQHTRSILEKCKLNEVYILILESLYNSVHQSIHTDLYPEILSLSLKISLTSDDESVRTKSCVLIAHFLNKAEHGSNFELLYELLKNNLAACEVTNTSCSKLILLYGWITKALVMRGSDKFVFWLQKIMSVLSKPEYCKIGAEAIGLIMSSQENCFTTRQHCRISLLYRVRLLSTFKKLADTLTDVGQETKEYYLLSWGHVLAKAPKSVLIDEVNKIAPLVVESLHYENTQMLLVMLDVLCHIVQSGRALNACSLQTILPRLINLTKFMDSMDVRIKALQCLYDIANTYRTAQLLPYKPDVLLDLAPSLDDKKRLVRQMAVRTRTRWFLVGAPGEAKPN